MNNENDVNATFGSFPICCLRYSNDPLININDILSYCIVEYAMYFQIYPDEQIPDVTLPSDFLPHDDLHIAILKVGEKFNCRLGSIDRNIKEHKSMKKFIDKQDKHQPYARLTLRFLLDTLIEVRKGNHKAYEFFCFVASIKALHGTSKQIRFFTIKRIRLAMNGYKGENEFDSFGDDKTFINYSNSKIQRLREKAEERKFFVSYTYHRRNTYYSTYTNDYTKEELAKIVNDRRNKKKILAEENLRLEYEAKLEEQERINRMVDLRKKIHALNKLNKSKLESKSLTIDESGSYCFGKSKAVILYSEQQIQKYKIDGLQVSNYMPYEINNKIYYYNPKKFDEAAIDEIISKAEVYDNSLPRANISVTGKSLYGVNYD